ncbi:Flp pilus assembly complex ATPase component TadA [Alicyclobacillus tolerans]|uniref:ATPase, T2SS/T4P/T4SS family n=1 Tax=Alicyclobacillus tolerans TaxID=90970 RepID=UPI001F3C2762|nr:ATPase, T2SS/T4P/T4SS family [Alicyclobacillus tolerans]MCF8568148.1 Flp pilus assembly complex ATPase component TadA [Alicyclobacillus tolerans]
MSVTELFQPSFSPLAYLAQLQQNNTSFVTDHAFQKACDVFEDYLDQLHDRKGSDYLQRQRDAIIGEPAAQSYFVDEIHTFLRMNPQFQSVAYPRYYPNLAEAIFQHVIGFGPLSVWFRNPTEAAHVIGTNILFQKAGSNRKILQPFSYESMEQVQKLIRSITLWDPLTQVSATQNWTEVNMYDGTRVTIMVPPMSKVPVLIFRQFPFKDHTFEGEAERGTVDKTSIRWWKLLSRLMLNTIVTGFRGSGKSTFVKVIYGARDKDLTVVTVERDSFEFRLEEAFPEREPFIIPVRTPLETMDKIFDVFLRADAHYIIVPEMRSGEIEVVLRSKEKGNGYLVTYHGQDMVFLPSEMARLSLALHPSYDYESELIRAARSLQVVVWMDELPSGRKVVLGVYAFDYSEETGIFQVIPWVTYNRESDTWHYLEEIPASMDRKLRELYPDFYAAFRNEFSKLAAQSPMQKVRIQKLHLKEAM